MNKVRAQRDRFCDAPRRTGSSSNRGRNRAALDLPKVSPFPRGSCVNTAILLMSAWLVGAEPPVADKVAAAPAVVTPCSSCCSAPSCCAPTCCAPTCHAPSCCNTCNSCCDPCCPKATFRDKWDAFRNVCGTYSTDCCGCCVYHRPTLKDRCCAFKSACGKCCTPCCEPCCSPCCK